MSAAQMSYLVEILLPQETGAGEPIRQQWFADLLKKLTSKFGGATSFMRSPGEGMWKSGARTQRDEIVIIEVMTDQLEQSFWKDLRERLEDELSHQEIVIRSQEIRRL
jgi:hypothetical protein